MTDKNRSKGYDQSSDYGVEIGRFGILLAVGVPAFVVAFIFFGVLFS